MEKTEDIILEEKPSLGKSLSFARTRKELSQQDVADELNLGKDIINAIENDEPIVGMSATYVRGYQRAYIRFLELEESELLGENAESPQFRGTHDNLQIIDKNMSMRGSTGGGFSFPFRFLMPLLLIGLAIIYWPQISTLFSRDSAQTATQAATVKQETDTEVIQTIEIKPTTIEESIIAVVESVKESDAETQTDNADTDNAATDTEIDPDDDGQVTVERVGDSSESIESVVESSGEQENLKEEVTEEVEVASVDPQDAQTKITFVSTGESWLDIKDAQDTRLFRNILKLDRVTVSGVLPLKIRAGNLQAVRVLSFQGDQKKVDIFDDSTTVANFYIEKDQAGRLKFTTQ